MVVKGFPLKDDKNIHRLLLNWLQIIHLLFMLIKEPVRNFRHVSYHNIRS